MVSNVTTASSVGNGTVDVAANGARENQNNYSMDGGSIVNYVSGTAGQTGSYPGIAIPNPDSIQEFKVQTSQYDASSGRNPGANVTVVTKGGTNQFHGALWEFNRNNFFNANDFFFKRTEEALDQRINTPQTLKQNTFGGTLGGPIKKDKIFFFGSYQGIRQVNGIGTSGFASGYESNVQLLPWSDPADFERSSAATCAAPANGPRPTGPIWAACSEAACDTFISSRQPFRCAIPGLLVTRCSPNGSNITNTAIALLQAPGPHQERVQPGFLFPQRACNVQRRRDDRYRLQHRHLDSDRGQRKPVHGQHRLCPVAARTRCQKSSSPRATRKTRASTASSPPATAIPERRSTRTTPTTLAS